MYKVTHIKHKNKYNISYDMLYMLYITQNKTITEIANILNLSNRTIAYLLQKEKIKKDRKNVTKRVIENNLKKYGVSCTLELKAVKKKSKATCLKKYGTEYATQNKEIYNKIIQTNLNKYGVKYTAQVDSFIQKRKITCLKKYGYDNAVKNKEIQKKIFITKKANNSFNISKPEKEIYKLLLQKFPNVKYQYKSNTYPFYCDFYIPEKDLYIEYQGFWHHNKHPFDINNKIDIETLNLWKINSKTKKAFHKAINVWTERDPLKRQIAKDNCLNWLEFFTFNDFLIWYGEQ